LVEIGGIGQDQGDRLRRPLSRSPCGGLSPVDSSERPASQNRAAERLPAPLREASRHEVRGWSRHLLSVPKVTDIEAFRHAARGPVVEGWRRQAPPHHRA
jgi:hypothetical protein